MTRNTRANRVGQWRRQLPRQRLQRQQRGPRVSPPQPRRLNFSSIRNRRQVARTPTSLENTIRVGAIRPVNASIKTAMVKGKIPPPVRALLLLAMSNPYTSQTKAAMNAAAYLQSELNKHKKKSKSK